MIDNHASVSVSMVNQTRSFTINNSIITTGGKEPAKTLDSVDLENEEPEKSTSSIQKVAKKTNLDRVSTAQVPPNYPSYPNDSENSHSLYFAQKFQK